MGMPVIGTIGNIEGFTRHDLVRHVQSRYVAQQTVVAAAGNFDVDAWLALAGELFAAMPASADLTVSRPPEPARYVGQAMARRFTQVSQVFLNIAYPLAPARPEEMSQPRWRLAAVAGGQPVRRRDVGAPGRHRSGSSSAWPTRPIPRWTVGTSGPTSRCMRSRPRTSSTRW